MILYYLSYNLIISRFSFSGVNVLKTKKCKTCGTVYEYETEEQLKEFFYKKGDWFRNECKKCELQQRKIKYANGEYNYSQKNKDGYYDNGFSFGFF